MPTEAPIELGARLVGEESVASCCPSLSAGLPPCYRYQTKTGELLASLQTNQHRWRIMTYARHKRSPTHWWFPSL